MNSKSNLSGFILLDKPIGISSAHALHIVKTILHIKKAGHAGSLDPLATGVLPICINAATRFSALLLNSKKTYYFTIKLGSSTTTGDKEGEILKTDNKIKQKLFTQREIENVLLQYRGEIQQIPPMYSSLKHEGKKLYELARKGINIKRQSRTVEIISLDLINNDAHENTLTLKATCSKGTYIRVLAEDIAESLGTYGHIVMLRRVEISKCANYRMYTIDEIRKLGANIDLLRKAIIPIDAFMLDLPEITVNKHAIVHFLHGRYIISNKIEDIPFGKIRVYDATGKFYGLGRIDEKYKIDPEIICCNFDETERAS